MIRILAVCAALGAAACSALPAADGSAVATDADRIEAQIAQACAASGLFKIVGGVASIAVPVAALPVSVIQAGVDRVCADPARFARDAGTVSWVMRNLRDITAPLRPAG